MIHTLRTYERLAFSLLIVSIFSIMVLLLWILAVFIVGSVTGEAGSPTTVIGSDGLEYATTTLNIPTDVGNVVCITVERGGVSNMACVR